jgi:hypothetical protein
MKFIGFLETIIAVPYKLPVCTNMCIARLILIFLLLIFSLNMIGHHALWVCLIYNTLLLRSHMLVIHHAFRSCLKFSPQNVLEFIIGGLCTEDTNHVQSVHGTGMRNVFSISSYFSLP